MTPLIYLDYAASSPPYEAVCQTVLQCSRNIYANPSAIHSAAAPARRILRDSRRTLSEIVGVPAENFVFTSGGTESNNMALLSGAYACHGRKHILVGAGEHSSVLEPTKLLRSLGFIVEFLPLEHDGTILPRTLESRISKDTALVSVQAVNNETGTIQDVAAISHICRSVGALYHCDAVQGFGHTALPLHMPDLVSISAHKFGGVRGAGCLFVRKGLSLAPYIRGGGQEFGMRSGTENIPAIAGMAQAAQLSFDELESEQVRLSGLSSLFLKLLKSEYPDIVLNAESAQRIPGILSLHFPGLDAERLLVKLDSKGICISAGAACASGNGEPSHVLRAMNIPSEQAKQTVRISPGRNTTELEIRSAAESVLEIYSMR